MIRCSAVRAGKIATTTTNSVLRLRQARKASDSSSAMELFENDMYATSEGMKHVTLVSARSTQYTTSSLPGKTVQFRPEHAETRYNSTHHRHTYTAQLPEPPTAQSAPAVAWPDTGSAS